ncbi:Uncharacterised protein [Klebsiella pneumoniae subsp. ozaenae]|uniref:Uncharacterized protein n=1 Tax=Klebsiella pneumoniae subsp. ozaenae TaxID=574 RepID=A0A378BWT1_KLEPO|nr:Uncharacterised protein [Klebsiella pneumoniae subsp. ozaenae]
MVISSLQSVNTVGGDPRAVIETVAFQRLAAAQQARAFAFAALDIAQNVVAMGEADQRAEVGVVGKQIAGADAGHPLEDLVLEFRLPFRRDKHPGAVGAHLAGAVKVGHHGNIGGEVEVGIVGDNQRRFAAQLHGDLFQ